MHGELPLVLLTLIGRSPMHGYELMQQLGALLAPAYAPSPGSVYPALAALVAEGLVECEAGDSRRRQYELTARGRTVLRERRSTLRAFEVRTGVRLDNEVRSSLERFVEQVRPYTERLPPDVVDVVLQRAATELEARVGRDEVGRGRRV